MPFLSRNCGFKLDSDKIFLLMLLITVEDMLTARGLSTDLSSDLITEQLTNIREASARLCTAITQNVDTYMKLF